MRTPYRKQNLRQAFTLIELLLVLVILAILAGIVIPKFAGRSEQAKVAAAKSDIAILKTSLALFETDTGRFPTTDEGLNALVTKPGDLAGWQKPYIEKLPNDPWGRPYIYRQPGTNGRDFDVISVGSDGQEGSADDVEP